MLEQIQPSHRYTGGDVKAWQDELRSSVRKLVGDMPRGKERLNVRNEPIFPIAAARTTFTELRAIYRAAGAEEKCRFVVGQGGHHFYADDAWLVLTELLKQL